MKSKYRCLVEDILSCEQKLREAKAIQRDAQEKLTQANGFVSYQEASLRENERKLAEIETVLFGSETSHSASDSCCHIRADRFAVTMAENANGQYVCTGAGLGIDPTQGETKDGQTARTELSQALREEIAKVAGKQYECLVQRLDKLSLEILAAKGESDAAKILVEQRLAAIESAVGLLKLR